MRRTPRGKRTGITMRDIQNRIDRKKFRELVERATRDKLSGLLTRGTAETYIRNRLKAMPPQDSCAVMIIDLDDFKAVNDTLGHQVGDEVIIHTAKALAGSFRAGDIVSRWGGDEFLVFLSGSLTRETVHEKALEVSEKLQFMIGQNPCMAVSASIGIYMSTTGQRSFRAMFRKADEALYSVKRTGKHGLCIKADEQLADIHEDSPRSMRPLQISELHNGLENGIALLEVGPEIEIIYVNHGFCVMLHAEAGFQHQQPLRSIVHPDDWEEFSAAVRQTAATGQNMTQVARIGGEGSWNWWNIKAARIQYPGDRPVLMMVSMDISNVKNSELQLRESNSMYREALVQMDSLLWEVDIPSRIFTLFQGTEKRRVLCRLAFPDGLVSEGLIREESRDRLTAFADLLLKGVPGSGDNFLVEDPRSGQRRWASMTYNVSTDADGNPVRAIGLMELLSRDSEEKPELFSITSQMEGDDILFGMICDLTEDTLKEFWYEGMSAYGQLEGTPCSEVFERVSASVVIEEAPAGTQDYLDTTKLKEMYRAGRSSFLLRLPYRLKDRKISLLYAGLMDLSPEDGHLCLSAYVNRIDRIDRVEKETGEKLESDPETGFLSPASFAMAASQMIRSGAKDSLCGLAAVRISGSGGNRNLRQRIRTAAVISLLDTQCVFAGEEDGGILMFFPDVRSKGWLFDKMEKMLTFVRRMTGLQQGVKKGSAAAGVSCRLRSEASYEEMREEAVRSAGEWKNPYRDGVVFPPKEDGWTWQEISHSEKNDRIVLHRSEIDRPLSVREKEAAFSGAMNMLRADTTEEAVDGALQAIGRFYGADRVYLLALAENDRIVVMANEWSDMRRPSIRHAISGMLTDRLPILQRCMKEKKPVYLTRQKPFSAEGGSQAAPWHFIVFPLLRQNAIAGFMCVDNPKEHASDGALLYVLAPYIIKQLKHSSALTEGAGYAEEQGSYADLYQIDFRRYQSVGLLCADLPNLSDLSRRKGFEYRSRMLWYLAHEMEDIFGRENVYRTGQREFAAVSPGTPRQVFLGRCLRLRARMQRVYPGECRIGSAYRQGNFYPRMLVDEARSAMYFSRMGITDQQTIVIGGCSYGSIREAAEMERLVLYAQPVIRRDTNTVAGAEVLIRGVDPSGGLILPGRFLPALERGGGIRDLDLFGVERTLSWMEHLVRSGRRVPDLSVNLSWKTLKHPSALASYLAVQSRFPDAPENRLLFELQPVPQHEIASLRNILQQFAGVGVRFLLDSVTPDSLYEEWFDTVKIEAVKFDRRVSLDLTDGALRQAEETLKKRGIPWVMKGIETAEQAVRLEMAGCLYVQGHAFRRAEALSALETETIEQE